MTSINIKKYILLAGDLVIFYALLYVTLLLRYQSIPDRPLIEAHLPAFSLIFLCWLVILYIANLYDLRGAINNGQFWRRTITAITFSGLFAALIFYIMPIGIAPKTNLLIYFGLFLVIFPLWRQFFNLSILSNLPRRRIGLIGDTPEIQELVQELATKKHLGYEVSMQFKDSDEHADRIVDIVAEKKISLIVISTSLHESAGLRNALFACLPLGVDFVGLPDFYEDITGRVPINIINQAWFLENLSEGDKARFQFLKRYLDILASAIFLLLSGLFWPVIALLIKAESKGPVFFRQIRLGKNGRPFTMIKFRTMREDNNNFSLTVQGDKRITRVGNFLRKSRLDEIPQLINIIKGEMSFVGPRPERPEFVTELEKNIPFYRERLLVEPGVTGWDQVSGEYHSASVEDTIKKLQYDLYYIKNRSLYLDLAIILKTIYTVLSRTGL